MKNYKILTLVVLFALIAQQRSFSQTLYVPITPPVIYRPVVVYQPLQYQRTVVVPRRTYFGNRWFRPLVMHQYQLPVINQSVLAAPVK